MEQQEKLKLSCVKEKKMLIAYEISHIDMIITSKSVKELWLEWYPEDATYFDMLPYKWDTCYNWISKYINKHDSKFIYEAIKKQRIRQKRELNKKLKYTNTNAYIILIKSNIKRNQLAKYLYVNGAEKRTGDFGSMVAYIKSLKEIPKNK